MARKHRRRTHKRNKGGGSVLEKLTKGVEELKTIGARAKDSAGIQLQDVSKKTSDGYKNLKRGYVEARGSPPPKPSSFQEQSPLQIQPTPSYSVGGTLESKEKKGGLLGLGTWIGLGGRRTAHTSFVNKMLRVKNSRKRNRASRKYLTGCKKRKTRKGGRRKRKRKTKKRRRR